jgi:uncharacterized Tic20 family protein
MGEKDYAAMIHILGPITLGIVPLMIWVLKRESSDFVDFHGKSFLNYFICILPLFMLTFFLSFTTVGRVLFYLILSYMVVFGLISIIKAYQGEYYEYPFIIRMIKR